jgi:hypothetical protein
MKKMIAKSMMIGLMGLMIILGWGGLAEANYPYTFPSEAKVKITRNTKGQSWLYLEFMWSKSCPPNFEKGKAVEFEITIVPKCFVRPKGGKDNNSSCDSVMGEFSYYLPGGKDNCYVDVWNYYIPPASEIVGLIEDPDRCGDLDWWGEQCAWTATELGIFEQNNGNFAVGVRDASQFKAGERYAIRYPVEINNTPVCENLVNYETSVGNQCAWDVVHNEWGRARVTMQTFNNVCDLGCDGSNKAYSCPFLIGATGGIAGFDFSCKNVDKHTDFWLNRLCVPTGDWPFTPGFGIQLNQGCINEKNRIQLGSDLASHNSCCWDKDNDSYYKPPSWVTVPMFGTRTGDCNDNKSSVNPGAIEIVGDGIDNDCRGGDSPLLGTTSPPIIACSNCSFQPTCWDGLQNQNETGIDCGGICPPCSPTGPEALASGLNTPWDLTLDSSYVYWVEKTFPGALKRVPKSGGQVMTLTSSLLEPTSLTIAGNYVYVLERNNGSNGRISRVPLNGGNPELVTSGLNNAQDHLVQDGTKLFWGDYGMIGNSYGGMIKSTSLGTNVSASILVQGNGLDYLSTPVDVDSSFVYFTASYGPLMKVTKGGGTPSVLGSGMPSSIRWYGATLYFTDGSSNPVSIKSMPKTGGSATLLATAGGGADLAVDGTHVYWVEYNNNPEGGVYRVPVNGGPVKTYSSQSNTLGIEVDSIHVYWAENFYSNGGKIMRAPK